MTQRFPDDRFLSGNFAPDRMECDAPDLEIEGDWPEDLQGTFLRNGSNPLFPPRDRYHLFSGDGMIHSFRIEGGRVAYRNRWVRTDKWKLEEREGRALFGMLGNPMTSDPLAADTPFNVANTHVIHHGGRLLALEEGNPPFELEPASLAPVGPWTFGGRLDGPMTAHPKIDPETGEMLFFGYHRGGLGRPTMSYQVVAADGELIRSDLFEAPYSAMVHDFIVTRNFVVFPIFPATTSLERAIGGGPPIAWDESISSRFGFMRRSDPIESIRWFEAEPCFVYHPMNAYEEGDRLIADLIRYDSAPGFPTPDGGRPDPQKAVGRLERWTFDLSGATDSPHVEVRDELASEFPRIDERFAGLPYGHGFMNSTEGPDGKDVIFDQIAHVDFAQDRISRWNAGEGCLVGEPVFVPRSPESDEGDGHLLAIVYVGPENRSDLVVFDALSVADGPLARARLDVRVPNGFHGSWIPDHALSPPNA